MSRTWNVITECNQLSDRLNRTTKQDHRNATVDVNGDEWLRALDRLQPLVMQARHEAAAALVDLGY